MAPDEMGYSNSSFAPGPEPRPVASRRTLMFANDKSSGKTTTANAVLVSLLDRYPLLMRSVGVREYDRQPRLATIFRKEDGVGSMTHHASHGRCASIDITHATSCAL